MHDILNIMLQDVLGRAKTQMNISLSLDESGRSFLIEKGFNPKFGARPLRRTIQTELEDPLSEEILNGHVHEGDHVRIKVDQEQKKLVFSVRKPATRQKKDSKKNIEV